jgi:hypothetical protein
MTRPRRTSTRLAACLAAGVTATLALAQQQPAPAESPPAAEPAPAQPGPTDASGPAQPAATAPAQPADEAPGEAARKPAAATGSPQRFEPTEKVRPDFDVAFPVDI